jgi:hypothetical protein
MPNSSESVATADPNTTPLVKLSESA